MQNQTREQWLGEFIAEIRPVFGALNHPLPDKIRVTCGFPSKHARSALKRRIGEHWSPSASSDGTHEIFISPVIDDPVEAIGVLVHELAHAATDGDGHQGRFPTLVKSLKLEGKPSATTVGADFRAEFGALIDSLGQYPHARLNVNDRKKQPTRLLKAWCSSCGYTVRVTGKWAAIGLPICPTCNEHFRT
jgi:hypothetical protein